MKIAYFDCFAGISGDMTLGALVDLGLDVDELKSMLTGLGITSAAFTVDRIMRHGIGAVKLSVATAPEHHHRHLGDILEMIHASPLSDNVKEGSERIFTRIAEAESTIHGLPVDKVHFHEVGALDSIIDIVGSVWGLERLGIARCFSSAVSLGTGTIRCEHGTLPVPAPATLELLKDFPVVKKEVAGELCTPTGAAIVSTLAQSDTGYGCGDRECEQFPNILRLIVGETVSDFEADRMLVVETNIDDMNAELYPYVMEKLLQDGAVDVYVTPIQMKKGRPGHMLTMILEEEKLHRCLDTVFRETTTLGVRIHETFRQKLRRSSEEIHTPWGSLRVKICWLNGKKRIVPEFEECKTLAQRENIPLIDVLTAVNRIGNADD